MSDSLLTDMGKRIAARRKELRLTQETVAERMGLSLQSVSCFELGKKAIRPENLVNLCRVLEVSPNYLLTGAREPETLTAPATPPSESKTGAATQKTPGSCSQSSTA